MKTKLLRAGAWQSTELAEPRDLLQTLALQPGATVENPEQIAHDLWPAISLPALPWVDRVSLLLAGFDLTFVMGEGGSALRLVPIPEVVAIEKSYAPRGFLGNTAAQLRSAVPEAAIRVEGGKLSASGSLEALDKIESLLAGQSVRTPQKGKTGPAEKRYSLTVAKEPAGAVLRTVAKQLGKELKYDESLLPKLKQEAKFSVKDVTLDELLTTTLKPLGLSYQLTDSELKVVAAE